MVDLETISEKLPCRLRSRMASSLNKRLNPQRTKIRHLQPKSQPDLSSTSRSHSLDEQQPSLPARHLTPKVNITQAKFQASHTPNRSPSSKHAIPAYPDQTSQTEPMLSRLVITLPLPPILPDRKNHHIARTRATAKGFTTRSLPPAVLHTGDIERKACPSPIAKNPSGALAELHTTPTRLVTCLLRQVQRAGRMTLACKSARIHVPFVEVPISPKGKGWPTPWENKNAPRAAGGGLTLCLLLRSASEGRVERNRSLFQGKACRIIAKGLTSRGRLFASLMIN